MKIIIHRIILTLFCIGALSPLYSRDIIDSLEQELDDAEKNRKVDILIELAKESRNISDKTVSFDYANQALELSKELNYKKGIGGAYHYIALYYHTNGEYDEAVKYYEDAINVREEVSDFEGEATSLNNLGNIYIKQGNQAKALKCYEKSLKIAEEYNLAESKARANTNIGRLYFDKGNFREAVGYFNKAEKLKEELDDKFGRAIALLNLGNSHIRLGEYEKALKSFQTALTSFESIEHKIGTATCYNSIGSVYENLAKSEDLNKLIKAREYYNKALNINMEIENFEGVGNSFNNIGTIYSRIGKIFKIALDSGEVKKDSIHKFTKKKEYNFNNAISYYKNARKNFEKAENLQGIASAYNNLASVYKEMDNLDMAIENYDKALELSKQINKRYEISLNYLALGQIKNIQGKYQEALEYLKKASKIAREIDVKITIQDTYKDIAEVYDKIGDYKNAYTYYKKYASIKDSIFNEESNKVIEEMAARFESEKKEQQIAFLNKSNKQQRIMIYGMVLVFFIIAGFLVVIFRQYRAKKRANILLAEQNDLITEQKKEITDSIHYASRIQKAILPPEHYIKENLRDYFILYKPRDIVSGDYYWMTQKDEYSVVVAADCTGHGVPGAFMSMLGVAFLNEIVNKYDELDASRILFELRKYVIKSLHQTGETGGSKDGMDLALCIIDWKNHKVQFSGANNPLYIIRNKELIEYKPDKMPIGIYAKGDKPFSNNDIDLKKDDTLIIFSDGYADQFGGPKGKKFKYKTFKELLVQINDKPMQEQMEILDDRIEKWRGEGSLEQVDDILVMGIKI